MPAAFWYYGLVIVSIVLITVSLRHRQDWKLLVLHLGIASIIYPVEVFIFVTKGYKYKPDILVYPPGADNILGAYISDFFIVPASAVLIQAFSLSRPAILCIAGLFTGIDWFFTVLGIYQHFWWKSIYTGIGLLVLYTVSDWFWTGIKNQHRSRLFRLFVIYLTHFALQGVFFFAVNRGGVLFQMHIPQLQADIPQLTVLVGLYQLIISAAVTVGVGLKHRRYKALGIFAAAAVTWAIGHFGIFIPQADITPYHLLILSAAALAVTVALFRAAKLDGFIS